MPNDAMQVLTAAVTPVVLVSATAILISGANTRYISISDRMRGLAHEFRDPNCVEARRATIAREMLTFDYRIRLIAWAVRALYAAVGAFVSDALLISATLWRNLLASATLPLFLAGMILILFAIACQLLELQSSSRTISVEIRDVLQMRHPGGS
jgi:Protein of unknown function (DUF2721)